MALVFVFGLIFCNSTPGTVERQDASWRQKVVLFQSTRADMEKTFGKPFGRYYYVRYDLTDGALDVEYYGFDRCNAQNGLEAVWNLPEWTVTELIFRPNNPPDFDSFHLDLKKFRKVHESPHVPDLISYVNDEEGVDYTFEPDGKLNEVRYFPGSRYDRFRCPKK